MKRARRGGRRGAAMVEGAVVLSVLVIFYGLTMYIHNAYLKKLQVQSETRFLAFASAANGCAGGGGGQSGISVNVPPEGNAPDGDKDAALQPGFFKTSANKTAVAVALGRSRQVSGASSVYCNPGGGVGAAVSKMKTFADHAFRQLARWAGGLFGA